MSRLITNFIFYANKYKLLIKQNLYILAFYNHLQLKNKEIYVLIIYKLNNTLILKNKRQELLIKMNYKTF